jgi:hypothetical protein
MGDEVCADCGRRVERRRNGHWAERITSTSWSFTCRAVVEGDVLVSADYHYVEGEQQRHFPNDEGEPCSPRS